MSFLSDRVRVRVMRRPGIASIALGIAIAGTVGGCASSPFEKFGQRQSNQAVAPVTEYDFGYSDLTGGHYAITQMADGEEIRVSVADHSSMQGQTDSLDSYFVRKAQANNLSARSLSEAQIGMTQVQAKLASARAAELDRDAVAQTKRARLASNRAQSKANENSSLMAIEELKQHQQARKAELVARLGARERQMKATIEKNAMLRTRWPRKRGRFSRTPSVARSSNSPKPELRSSSFAWSPRRRRWKAAPSLISFTRMSTPRANEAVRWSLSYDRKRDRSPKKRPPKFRT